MRKLLSAGFHRLWRSLSFWLVFAGSIAAALVIFWSEYSTSVKFESFVCTPETAMFELLPLMAFACPVLISLFQGTEYSDGTVRNKLICGHRRMDIYFSALAVCFSACALCLAAGCGLLYGLGALMLDPGTTPAGTLLLEILCAFLQVLAISAICVFVTMNVQRKTAGAMISVVMMTLLLFAGSWLDSELNEGEMTSMGMIIHEDGTAEWLEPEPNPLYIGGAKRTVMEFAEDLLPTGQIIRSSNGNFERVERWPVLSLALTAAVSAGGVLIFKKKDIK